MVVSRLHQDTDRIGEGGSGQRGSRRRSVRHGCGGSKQCRHQGGQSRCGIGATWARSGPGRGGGRRGIRAGGGGNWPRLPAAPGDVDAERAGAQGRAERAAPVPGRGSPRRPSHFVPLPPPGLGLGFSVDAGNNEDRSSRSSTAAPAPRVPLPGCDHASVVLSSRERDRPWPRAAAAATSISTEAGCSRSSVESDLRSSNAVVKARQQLGAAGLNGVRKVFSGCCGHGDEEQLSQEVRSTGRCRGNGSSVECRSVRSSAGEESVGNGGNGRMYWGADPCNESILVLHTAQEALENGMVKLSMLIISMRWDTCSFRNPSAAYYFEEEHEEKLQWHSLWEEYVGNCQELHN
ncbi:uncharacterized protein [Miscanthus floridulus]|uniref:uncharacterized protein n=1 Tax=Miscanthus floridulus TaxID=154761 RepID=UPI00345B2AF3